MHMIARPGAVALNRLTASESVKAVRSGDTTCEAVARSCLERIAERDRHVQAWQYMDPDQAIAAARPGERRRVEALCRRAGLNLPEHLLLQLCDAAPYAQAMVDRIPIADWEDEPANVFTPLH